MKLILTILTILSSFLANLETKTLQSDFTVTVAEEVNAPMNFPGSLTMCGKQFKLVMFGIEAAYDGKTLYMYSADSDELTLTNPSEQELVEANPFLYARALVDVCNITERANSDNTQTTITLTPKNLNEQKANGQTINRFVVKVRNSDLMPLSAEIKEGKKTSTLKMKDPAFITTKQDYTITPDKSTFVNDLRF